MKPNFGTRMGQSIYSTNLFFSYILKVLIQWNLKYFIKGQQNRICNHYLANKTKRLKFGGLNDFVLKIILDWDVEKGQKMLRSL